MIPDSSGHPSSNKQGIVKCECTFVVCATKGTSIKPSAGQ